MIAYNYLYSGEPLQSVVVSDEGQLGAIRSYTPGYGAEGELLSMVGNLNPYSVIYDALYRPLTLTDGKNHTTTYNYAPAGLLNGVTYPDNDFIEALTWDHNDQVLTVQNGRGQSFTYVYNDNESRLTQALSLNVDDQLAYDGYGRLQSLSDASGVRAFTYDDDDLPLTQAVSYSGLPANSTFTFGYGTNDDGSRSSLSVSNAVRGVNLNFSYSYDGRGELTGLTNPYGESFGWSYYANGWLQTQTSANAATTTYSYNALGELTDLHNAHGSTSLSDFNMASSGHYDGAGNLLGLTATLPGSPAAYSGTTSYQYDGKDQLNHEQSSRFVPYTNSFGYDAAGNPTTFKGAA